jgi:uncharacterized membrane protein
MCKQVFRRTMRAPITSRRNHTMFGLTTLGSFHTVISIIAVAAGLIALVRDREITPRNTLGQVYLWTTVVTCITGFGIFQHGGFGKPHALGVITLIVLAVLNLAGRGIGFGRSSRYVETVGYSLTFFFHLVPALAETFTRLPSGSPVFSSPEDPILQALDGFLFLLFLVGATWQVRRLRAGGIERSLLRGA